MVSVDRVSKRFGTVVALEGICFSAGAGIVAVAGPNGAGKTTLVRILSGVLLPTEGSVSVNGVNVTADPVEARARTGTVFENAPVYSGMTVEGYLSFVARARGLPRKESFERVEREIARCGLGQARGRLTDNLSRGFRQRTALAAALIHDPVLLVLDEPSSGLDPVQIAEFWNLVASLAREKTVIISTHNMREIERLDAAILLVNEGRLVAQGTTRELLDRSGTDSLEGAFIALVSGRISDAR